MNDIDELLKRIEIGTVEREIIDLPIAQPDIAGLGASDYLDEIVQFSITHDDYCIANPYFSTCGRFQESPATYGLSEDQALLLASMNKTLYDFQMQEVDRIAEVAQKAMGVTDGGPAAAFLMDKSDEVSKAVLANANLLAPLLVNELQYGASPDLSAMRALVEEMAPETAQHFKP